MKKPLVIVGVLAVAALALKLWSGAASEPSLVFNRIWLDHLPRSEKDTVNVFAALTRRESLGLFQTATRWRGSYELFRHESIGGELRIVFPQTGEKETVRARAWNCKEREMDYCLELTGSSRGVRRYQSRKGWELGASATTDETRSQIESQLESQLESIVRSAGQMAD